MSEDASEVLPVVVELIGIEHIHRGSLLSLISFAVVIHGIEVRIQGAQIRKAPHGQIELTAPMFKSGTGHWLPAIELPDEIMLQVLELLGDDWRKPSSDLRLMMAPPELSLGYVPRVERKE
jgi:hypothetical protein